MRAMVLQFNTSIRATFFKGVNGAYSGKIGHVNGSNQENKFDSSKAGIGTGFLI